MNAIVLEHVPLTDLPQAWRDKLARELARGSNDADGLVTVRIEAEHAVARALPNVPTIRSSACGKTAMT